LRLSVAEDLSFALNVIGPVLIEIVRTNDLVMISVIESLLTQEGVPYFVADQHMSAMEGSLGFLPRRIMVETEQRGRARRLLQEAGLAAELRHE
jgi:Putative prokaryotic signal transducing protein